jgi:hypothetical protein
MEFGKDWTYIVGAIYSIPQMTRYLTESRKNMSDRESKTYSRNSLICRILVGLARRKQNDEKGICSSKMCE